MEGSLLGAVSASHIVLPAEPAGNGSEAAAGHHRLNLEETTRGAGPQGRGHRGRGGADRSRKKIQKYNRMNREKKWHKETKCDERNRKGKREDREGRRFWLLRQPPHAVLGRNASVKL